MEATGKKHEWQVDALRTPATNKSVQGADAVGSAVTATVEKFNFAQIANEVPIVTGSQQAILKAGRANEMDYQISKMSKEMKTDMELDLLSNTIQATGSSGTEAISGGIQTWLETNLSEGAGASTSTGDGADARSAGSTRAFTESMLKEVLREAWDSGGNPDLILVGGFNKQKFSTFTGNATREVSADDEALYAAIDIYKSDFGELQVVPNRSSNNSTQAYVLQRDLHAVAYLREFQLAEIAKTGDAEKVQILVEYTYECRNEKGSGAVYDLSTA